MKPGYKLTEVGMVPEEWGVRNLAEVSRKITDGDHVTPKRAPNGHYLLSARNVLNGRIDVSDVDYVGATEYQRMRKRCAPEAGDILISCSGTIGRVAVVPPSFECVLVRSAALAKINHELADGAFLQFWLQGNKAQGQIASSVNQGAQPNLFLNHIERLTCPHPPLSEQRAIAAALSDVDALLGGLDQLIGKKHDLKQAAMQQLLTGQTRLPGFRGEWEVKRLGELAEIISGGTPKTTESAYWNGGIRWCTPTDITGCVGKYLTDTERTISQIGLNNSGATLLPVGALLLCSRATIGELKIASVEVCTNQGFKSLICHTNVSNEFLYYKLLTMKQQMIERAFGSTFLEISRANVSVLQIRTPPLSEQTAIAAILSDMDAELAALEARRNKTLALKQGMMQELLTGRTRLVAASSNVGSIDFTTKQKPGPLQPSATKSHNWQINEAVVVAVLVKQFGSEQYPLGRKRCTKLAYLLHRHVEHVAEGYLKKAAGPYNPDVKYKGPEGIAQKNGYIRAHTNGRFSGFVASGKIAQAEGYFDKWYGRDVLTWLERFRHQSNDELELLATVDMAVGDVKRINAKVSVASVKSVIRDHPEWEAKLDRAIFSDANIARAIRLVSELFPTE